MPLILLSENARDDAIGTTKISISGVLESLIRISEHVLIGAVVKLDPSFVCHVVPPFQRLVQLQCKNLPPLLALSQVNIRLCYPIVVEKSQKCQADRS